MPVVASERRILIAMVHACAASMLGFVTLPMLHELDVSARRAQSWCDSGLLHRIARGLYHVSLRYHELSREQHIIARLLTAGPDARLTRLAALEISGGTRFATGPVDIVVPTKRVAGLTDTRIHVVRDLDHMEPCHIGAVPATPIEWTISELGQDLGRYQITNVLHSIEYRDRCTDLADRVEAELDRRRHIGAPDVRAAIALYRAGSAGTRTRTEDRYLRMALRVAVTAPTVNCVHQVAGGSYEVDFMWRGSSLRVEIDGGQHGRIPDQMSDAASDEHFADLGVLTLREHWRDVWRDLPGCAARLRRQLASR